MPVLFFGGSLARLGVHSEPIEVDMTHPLYQDESTRIQLRDPAKPWRGLTVYRIKSGLYTDVTVYGPGSVAYDRPEVVPERIRARVLFIVNNNPELV